jgi:hypothetical protein
LTLTIPITDERTHIVKISIKIFRQKFLAEIRPGKFSNLSRPQLGRWVGAVSLSGELLCAGGAPKAALYHLRTLTPIDPEGLQV